MYTLMSLLCANTFAATFGSVVTTELRTTGGGVRPEVLLALVDPPDPDSGAADPPGGSVGFGIDGNVAMARVRYTEKADMHVVLGLNGLDVQEITYRASDEALPVVVWGRGAVDQVFPPDPCKAAAADLPPGPCTPLDPALPPGPCFELDALLTDGTVLGIAIALQSEHGELDPGSLVGFNPQPDPPGSWKVALGFDIAAYARGDDTVEISMVLLGDRAVLPLR